MALSKSTHVGFTGTRYGMHPAQKQRLRRALRLLGTQFILHHGDCVGADYEMHQIALHKKIRVELHPPTNPKNRAFCKGENLIKVHPEKPYLERNQDIVDMCTTLIACPTTMEEVLRSGTWTTIRKARTRGIEILIFFPNGEMEHVPATI